MRRSWRYLPQGAMALFLIGIVLVVVAYVQAASIPRRAHDDFGHLIRQLGGSMSHSANYDSTYRVMSAQRRMLQNAYVGGGGLILMTIGGLALVRIGTAAAVRAP
jgi:hypothetical protein